MAAYGRRRAFPAQYLGDGLQFAVHGIEPGNVHIRFWLDAVGETRGIERDVQVGESVEYAALVEGLRRLRRHRLQLIAVQRQRNDYLLRSIAAAD